MWQRSRLFAFAVASALALGSALPANAQEPWQISTQAEETSPGWFIVRAWATNVSGTYLHDCAVTLSVSGDGQLQPHSAGPIYLGDAANGETLYYEFNVYCPPGGEFTYYVEFVGYTYPSSQ